MKLCPQCNAHYDDSMFFCLEDGQPLNSTADTIQSNPTTFEQTLAFPTDEKTMTLPTQNESGGEKTLTLPADEKTLNLPAQNEPIGEQTLTLPAEPVTEQKSVGTAAWEPAPKTNEKALFTGYVESNEREGKSKFMIAGGLLGGIALLGTAVGGWWILQKPSVEVAVANVNKQPQNPNSLGLSNANLAVAFGEDNSNASNSSNTNVSANPNSNKSTPKSSPTTDKKDSPTPTPDQKSEPTQPPPSTLTPTPKTPKPTPEDTPPPVPKTVSAGVVNGKAANLVKPPYPPAAKAVRASGAVNVQVLIDENGNVISASAVSGHALLRASAEAAARASKFSPTMLAGQRVKVTGVIVYNFTAQ